MLGGGDNAAGASMEDAELPPMLGGGDNALGASMENAELPPMLGGGDNAAGVSMEDAGSFPFSIDDDFILVDGELFSAANQWVSGAGIWEDNNQWMMNNGGAQQESAAPQLHSFPPIDLDMSPWLSQFDLESLGVNQTANTGGAQQESAAPQPHSFPIDVDMSPWPSQFDLESSSLVVNQTATDSLGTNQVEEFSFSRPPAAASEQAQGVPDIERTELAEILRVASECGDEASAVVWSPDEDKLLLQGLSRLANEESAIMCIGIAFDLPKKTSLDVAKRVRWLQNKRKAPDEAAVRSKESAGGKTEKGEGTKDPNMKRDKHAPSEKALGSMSTKDLLGHNARLMDHIDDNLGTGQLVDTPSLFNSVKMNLDALLMKIKDMGMSTDGLSIDEEALEEVTRRNPHLSVEN